MVTPHSALCIPNYLIGPIRLNFGKNGIGVFHVCGQ